TVAAFGVGRMGAFHAGNLRRHPDVATLRIFDPDTDRATAVAAELEAVAARSIDEALDGASAAVIVTPSDSHAALVERCLAARIPALSEKPLALDLDETRHVVQRIEAERGVVQVGFQRRFDAGFAAARRAIVEGEIGT